MNWCLNYIGGSCIIWRHSNCHSLMDGEDDIWSWCLPSIMLYVMYVSSASAMTNEEDIFVFLQFKSNLSFFWNSCHLSVLLDPWGDNGAACPYVAFSKLDSLQGCRVQCQSVRISLFVWACWYDKTWQDKTRWPKYSNLLFLTAR